MHDEPRTAPGTRNGTWHPALGTGHSRYEYRNPGYNRFTATRNTGSNT
jgi:hypothetical protein